MAQHPRATSQHLGAVAAQDTTTVLQARTKQAGLGRRRRQSTASSHSFIHSVPLGQQACRLVVFGGVK